MCVLGGVAARGGKGGDAALAGSWIHPRWAQGRGFGSRRASHAPGTGTKPSTCLRPRLTSGPQEGAGVSSASARCCVPKVRIPAAGAAQTPPTPASLPPRVPFSGCGNWGWALRAQRGAAKRRRTSERSGQAGPARALPTPAACEGRRRED